MPRMIDPKTPTDLKAKARGTKPAASKRRKVPLVSKIYCAVCQTHWKRENFVAHVRSAHPKPEEVIRPCPDQQD